MASFEAPISEQIWDMKYRLKAAPGQDAAAAAEDKTVADSWRRVARALAAAEAPEARAAWERRFYGALEDFKFLPAGRILAGAGVERKVTLFNCFVMGVVPDDMAGIFEMLKEAALTMQQGGGIGYDFSTIRPRGAAAASVGSDASGPISFMDVWDAMCRTVMSAGSRRGAMMATMRCDHPDVEAFVAAKADPARLRNFNLSVLATDAFMTAVRSGGPWDLVFDGRVYKTVEARALWDAIMRATYDYAEPGVIFIDRINARNNLWYCETISATNPCVTRDAWVHTAAGPRQVAELIGRPFEALVDGAAHASGAQGFFSTGVKPVLRVETRCGKTLRLTADHPVLTVTEQTRWRIETAWRPAGQLKPGDVVKLHDHGDVAWGAPAEAARDEDLGYLLGLLVDGGVVNEDKAALSAGRAERTACGSPAPGPSAVMRRAEQAARRPPLGAAALKRLALQHGLGPGRKTVTPAIERSSSAFQAGFLRGLFDSDGSVESAPQKGASVRLALSCLDSLKAVSRMLGRLGINATLHREGREVGAAPPPPDGRDGTRSLQTRAAHELVVSGANLRRFADRIGFHDIDKATRLANALAGDKRTLDRERFVAVVASVAPDGEEEVFDVQVPGVNRFDANGVVAHNCGEQPLPPYGACLLGSINLARLVEAPFAPGARIDAERLAELVAVAVRMMDNVVDVSGFPLPAQAAEARAKRRIGLGVTGLADALAMLGLRYDAPDAVAQAGAWLRTIRDAAYAASARLAEEKGAFPLYDAERYLAGETIKTLPPTVRDAIAAHGVRNALLTSIAPTGTISLYAGNVSSGVEPIFAIDYTRQVTEPDGSKRSETVVDYAVAAYRAKFGAAATLPDSFVTAQDLAPAAHVAMQAEAQKWVDSAISKTINLPADISFEAFGSVYLDAYDSGCKGCTTYRPNDVTGSVLTAAAAPAPEPAAKPTPPRAVVDDAAGGRIVHLRDPLDRPEALVGATYKLRWPDSAHATYITINDIVEDGRRRPFEVFINSKNMEHYAWTVALTRMISAVFRRGGDVSFVVEELKAIFDPRGGSWVGGRYTPSILAAIGDVIERHMREIGFIETPREDDAPAPRRLGGACPSCGAQALVMIEGCATCAECGYSRCS